MSKPRISYKALCKLSGPLDTGVADKDWRLLSAYLDVSPDSDLYIQEVELKCHPTGKSPTMMVLRAWQQTLRVDRDIPVDVLTGALVEMGRIDVVSIVDQLIEDGKFFDSSPDPESLQQYRGQLPRENSYHERSSESLSTHNPRAYRTPRSSYDDPWCDEYTCRQRSRQCVSQNGKSVMSLPEGAVLVESSSQHHNRGPSTWPRSHSNNLLSRSRQELPMESTYRLGADIKPLSSLPQEGASPYPVTWFITFSFENRSAAVFLGGLLKKLHYKVLLDCPQLMAQQVKELFRQSMKIIIIYSPEYVQEVLGGIKSRLNTRVIYDLMCQEFQNNHGQNHRFIPVIDHDRITKSSIPTLFKCYPMQDANFICNLLQKEHRSGERKSSEEQPASPERKIHVYQEVCLERHEYGTK